MPNMILNNVSLAFTHCMTRESEFGGYSYAFIIDKDEFCNAVRKSLATQKTKIWSDDKNTDSFIIKKCNAKTLDDVMHEPTREAMKETDLLIQVKSKNAPIENSKKVPLGRGTVADILIDVFEFEYGKKQFICVRSHADRGCTVKVKHLNEVVQKAAYFEYEDGASADWDNAGINTAAIKEIVVAEVEDEEVPF